MRVSSLIDVLIIGGGPIGLACGIAAKKAGLSYLILEKGCLVNSLYNYPLGMTFFSTAEKLEIGGVPFVSTNPKPKRAEALEYYRRVSLTYDLNIHLFEEVKHVSSKSGQFAVTSNKGEYQAKNVIVATGFYDEPMLLNIPGENLDKVFHYYREPHYFANQNVVVVGASNSSVDAALETYRKGANVTLVVRGTDIGQRVKYWVRPDIMNRIDEGSIRVHYSSNLTAIREHEVDIKTPQGLLTIPNDFVLALTGYKPNFAFLEKIGIELSDEINMTPTYNPENMQTNINGIYLAGVVCGGLNTHSWFIENSRVHAEQIIEAITEKNK